jgi:hypothetical protein
MKKWFLIFILFTLMFFVTDSMAAALKLIISEPPGGR